MKVREDHDKAIQDAKKLISELHAASQALLDASRAAQIALHIVRKLDDHKDIRSLLNRLEGIDFNLRAMEAGSLVIEAERKLGEAWRRAS